MPVCRPIVALALAWWSAAAVAQPLFQDGQPTWAPDLLHESAAEVEAHRLAPPSEQEQAAAEKIIDRLLSGRIDLVGGDPERVVRELRALATATDDDPVARFVLWRKALGAATHAAMMRPALAIIDEMAAVYEVDELEMQLGVLRSCAEGAGGGDWLAIQEFAPILFSLVERALLADRPEIADKLLSVGLSAAERTGDGSLAAEMKAWRALVDEWAAQAQQARDAALKLLQQPRDPAANSAVGRYMCFVKGAWDAGLPMLARGGDEGVRKAASSELQADRHESPRARVDAADAWREVANQETGLARWRIALHADEMLRRAYPTITGLSRLKLEEKLLSRPLFTFDSGERPSDAWIDEHLRIWGGHGREGRGSWANVEMDDLGAVLVANRAGYIATREEFPPENVTHWEIEAVLWSDQLPGTAIEFGRPRMYFTDRGISFGDSWRPPVEHSVAGAFHHFVIDVGPRGVSFTIDGKHVGTAPTDQMLRGPVMLRGWEGHVRARRLVVWAVPDPTLRGYLAESAG